MTTASLEIPEQFLGSGASGATFSPCRTWRYCLWRRWRDHGIFDIADTRVGDDNQDVVAFIGLNPSTADESEDDPTIRRCIGFAKSWGFGGIAMLNLFAFRATDPKDMKAAIEPVGPWNDEAIRRVTRTCRSTICCWGAHGSYRYRDAHVRSLLYRKSCYCLGRTNAGHPKHPLYLKADTERLVF
jgi:hypothetical protein